MTEAYEHRYRGGPVAQLNITTEHTIAAKRLERGGYKMRLIYKGRVAGPVFKLRREDVSGFWSVDGEVSVIQSDHGIQILLGRNRWALVNTRAWNELLALADQLFEAEP